MSLTSYHAAVFGAGVVGLLTALTAARRGRTLLIAQARNDSAVPRIETVPAPMLDVLIDLGIHPRRLGVGRLYEVRQVAWEAATPQSRNGRAFVHIDKRLLELELLTLAHRASGLDLLHDGRIPTYRRGRWYGRDWSAGQIIDATGRAAFLASRRFSLAKPWVARPFWSVSKRHGMGELRMAALPFGFAYRVGNDTTDSLWVAGRGHEMALPPSRLQSVMAAEGVAWLLEGLPAFESLSTARAFPVSVQWAQHSEAIAVGDAALARDILSSQGVAAGFSSALMAAACESERDRLQLRTRYEFERGRHLQALLAQITSCRYADAAAWSVYRDFVAKECAPCLSPADQTAHTIVAATG